MASSANGATALSTGSGSSSSQGKTKELFNAALQSRDPANNYIAHLKIWEDVTPDDQNAAAAGVQKKARYLILAVQKETGRVTINKAKRNANGSFSIGKDWDLNTLQEVHVIEPDVFSITLTRTYKWQTQQPREQHLFLQSLVKVYRKYTQDSGPRLIGIQVPPTNGSSLSVSPSSGGAPGNGAAAPPTQPKAVPPQPTLNVAIPRQPSLPSAGSAASPKTGADRMLGTSPSKSPVIASRVRSGSTSSAGQASLRSLREGSSPGSALRTARLPPEQPASSSSTSNDNNGISSMSAAQSPPGNSHRANQSSDSLSVPPSSSRRRKNSTDSIRSNSTSASGGDARARLSSVEPVRGGAAYERMLLAGTGLSGVNEVADDDEEPEDDPYGGAVIGESDTAPLADSSFSSKRATLGRPKMARIDSSESSHRDRRASNLEEAEDEDATLLAVEEMLEGFEWRGSGGKLFAGSNGKRTADVIEARLLDELSALESANIHAIIESDDRVALVVQHMEEAISHLDMMDSMIAGFKVQLNSRADDISHIESQNRGLQVQTSNQRTLMAEIDNLINTINVDEGALHALSAGRLESDEGIAQLEAAAASLYKSMLQARQDGEGGGGAEMSAATERLAEHEATSARFCKRVLDYLNVTFNVETQRLLSDPARTRALAPPNPSLEDHGSMEMVLGRYCGLLLYMKEVSPQNFSRVSAAYFATVSDCYKTEMQKLFAIFRGQIKQATDDEAQEATFVPTPSNTAASAIRSGTIRRPGRDKSIKGGPGKGDASGAEAFQRALSSIIPVVLREQAFIADFLHINDNNITFADYMDIEPYFRRRAANVFGVSAAGPLREMKGALDLIFGFLAPELQAFTDAVMGKDKLSVFGLLAALDRAMVDAEELNCESLLKVLSKLHMRLTSQMDRFVQEQIKGIEQTKLTLKKRKGIVQFIRVFPVFVERVEAQLVNAETLPIRASVDGHYEQICRAMFDALQTISRADGGGVDEDKGQLNHHIILLENMWYFTTHVSRSRGGTNAAPALVKRAEAIYRDSLTSYVHFVLRRPLAKLMDFGDGIDALLRSTPAGEVSLHAAYSKSAAKRLVKELGAKDVRKAVEALSKRVQKHFSAEEEELGVGGGDADDAAEVLAKVWGTCEEGAVREFERLTRILRDCYEGGISCEVGPAELKRLFGSNAPRRR